MPHWPWGCPALLSFAGVRARSRRWRLGRQGGGRWRCGSAGSVEFRGLDGVPGRAEGQPPPSPGVPVAVPPARRRSPACRPHVSPGTEPDRHCRSCDPREPPGALLRRLWPLLSAPKLIRAETAQRSRRWIAHCSSQPSPLRSGPAEDGTRLLRDSSGVPCRSSASTTQGTSSGWRADCH